MNLTFVVPTIGRQSLIRTLRSITTQMEPEDKLGVVADGFCDQTHELLAQENIKPDYLISYARQHGDWGHTPRNNMFKVVEGDYILTLDDDDAYLPGAISLVRERLKQSEFAPHMFKMYWRGRQVLWEQPNVVMQNVSTQMIVTPNVKDKLGIWGNRYQGDFDYCRSLQDNWGKIVWCPEIIVRYGPDLAG